MRQKIQAIGGCRDCALCTGNAFSGMGRDAARMGANVATLGVAALVRKKCRGCEHPMSEHHVQPQQVVMAQQQPMPIPMRTAGWYQDPTDARCVCWHDGLRWYPESKRPR